MAGQKCRAYNVGFKLKISHFAEQSINSVAARHFTLNEKQVLEWRRKKKMKFHKCQKRWKLHVDTNSHFLNQKKNCPTRWKCLSKQVNWLIVTCIVTLYRGSEYDKRSNFLSVKLVNFVSSVGWCNHFMNWYRCACELVLKLF